LIKYKRRKNSENPKGTDSQILSQIIGSDPDLALNILNTVPTCVSITTDISCKEIWHNQKAAEFIRIKPWESFSCTASKDLPVTLLHKGKILQPDDMPIQRSVWQAEKVRDFEIESIWDDGVRKIAVWDSSSLLDKSGSVIGAVASFKDITELKKTEEALRLSEEKFSNVFYHNQTMMGIIRLKDTVIYDLNDKFADVLGYRRKELVGQSIDELKPGSSTADRLEIIDLITKYGCVKDYECKFIKKSEGIGYAAASFNFLDIDGEKYLLVSALDITKRKEAEEALRLSEKLFCKTFNANPLPMAIISIVNDVILEVNDAFLKRSGYTKQELIGLRTTDMGIWVDLNERLKLYEEMNKEGFVRNFEVSLSQKPGEVATFLLSASRISWKGETCLLGIANDITELKRYQKEIERLGRMTLIGEISASISHEIRNPMTTVRGFLQLLKEKDRYAQDKEFMDLMIDELDRANSIITEFLSLTKNKPVELKKRSLNHKIRSIFPLIKADALEQGKNIKLALGDIPHVKIDKNEIRQLLHNLVRNGLEAMPPGGLLTIKTYQEDDSVVLTVEDQGRGISPEVLEKIGTPFFTTKDTGTGLGLAVCYSIAARHQARIGIETGAEGTTFFVRFKT
jgi:PAS domain S-box-containing protein